MSPASVASPLAWAGFVGFVLVLLAVDLGIFHRKAHTVGPREAALWSVVWIALAACFAVGVYALHGQERALEFTAGYLLEKALAVDNIFVFVVLFQVFGIPAIHQHRVLFWGVLGALVMRAGFILAGGAFLHRFHFAMYLFGGILAFTGIKLLVTRDKEAHPERSRLIALLRRFLPTTPELHGGRFTVRQGGRLLATPLLLALVAMEASDLVFSLDSIPAVFAVTTDSFIVFTSNIFAMLGLRSLYFLLAGVIDRFVYLKTGLALVLVFVGAKMLANDVVHVPTLLSLGVIVGILSLSIVASMWRRARPAGTGGTSVAEGCASNRNTKEIPCTSASPARR
jgi:tellurite resistance protein TerC